MSDAFLKPFSFGGWQFPVDIQPPNFAEERAKMHERTAGFLERDGAGDRVESERDQAAWWRQLPNIDAEHARRTSAEAHFDAMAAIDCLAVLAEKSQVPAEDPLANLYVALKVIFDDLYALAACGRNDAAIILLRVLWGESDRFRALAFSKPEFFREKTRTMYGIPGIVSPHPEKTEDNNKLLELLEVGSNHHFTIIPTGKKGRGWKLYTLANRWAARLYEYVDGARSSYDMYLAIEQAGQLTIPAWLHEAANLAAFSSASCPEWVEIIWRVVLDATNGKPELESSLYPLGKSAEGRKHKYSKTTTARAAVTDVRGRIKHRLKEALKQMAAVPHTPANTANTGGNDYNNGKPLKTRW